MKYIFTLIFVLQSFIFFSQNDISLDYYLPQDVTYNPEIPTPQSVLGYVPGKWHVSHDKLINYMTVLANSSSRITIENRGKTFEDRSLILLTITSEKNHQNLAEIQKKHLELTKKNASQVNLDNLPAVVYNGFSIHGNEPSGSNAALIMAYYLAAAQSKQIDTLLENIIILFDPSLNPDGLQRFSYWVNTNKSKNMSTDPQDREYSEVWPQGRTNHYWFDMNRDWLPVQLPESTARIKTYYQWYPNILTDHHEMRPNSTYFFQPGIQSRAHPLIPKLNQELTKKIGYYHAHALDSIGSLYYTEENFDDFYYGKGSTFPDINGGIGILFEQASSRGHAQQTINGILTFPFTIKNQLNTTLSTLKAANSLRKELLEYKRSFFKDTKKTPSKEAYVFGNNKDAASSYHLAEILKKHQIKLYELNKDVTIQNKRFKKGYSYVVPKDQRQKKLLEAMFEKRTTFKDSLFYDVSAWTFPLAFNVDYVENASISHMGNEIVELTHKKPSSVLKSKYAYLIEWHEYYSPKILYHILKKGLRVKVGMKPFSIEQKKYDYGTILIPVKGQKLDPEELHILLQELSIDSHINITSVLSGLTKGIDLGSNDFKPLSLPKIGLLTGNGVTPYDAGEIWYLMDQRYDIPITKLTTTNFQRTDFSKYTHLILPNGQDQSLDKRKAEKLKAWTRNGGTLIGYRNMAQFFKNNELMNIEFIKSKTTSANTISFEQIDKLYGAEIIGGAIFEAKTDRSHPINFGYTNNKIALFRNTTFFIKPDKQSYNNPIQYTKTPLLSGYISQKNLDSLSGTVPFRHSQFGKGTIILFTDNTNFRGFWYGTNKLLMNAIFFSNHM